MKKLKPIFTVGLPNNVSQDEFEKIRNNVFDRLSDDYYVLVYYREGDIKFDCFYEKDFDEVKYEELKQIISEQINNFNGAKVRKGVKTDFTGLPINPFDPDNWE